MNQSLVIPAIVSVVVLGVVLIFIFYRRHNKTKTHKDDSKKESLSEEGNLRSKADFDARGLYSSVVGDAFLQTYVQGDKTQEMSRVFDCVRQKIKDKNIDLTDLNLLENKPLVVIHDKYPEVYNILVECGFLNMLGRQLSFPLWSFSEIEKMLKNNVSADEMKKSLESMILCGKNLGTFSDINIWNNLPSGPIENCANM